ncbi:MAG: N-acetylmuramoyl-L-alanine amidase [Rhodobacteraceae bacterium]|nr:N-acetylmuramoyl-L-alanine amidase [Paracoccaceae bacterium]
MSKKTILVIHTLAVRRNWMIDATVQQQVDEVTRWHTKERGWKAIAYAQIIAQNGTKAGGRDLDGDGDFYEEIGAHAKGFNVEGIGIALTGGLGGKATDKFRDHYTQAQRFALWDTIYEIRKRFGDLEIIGHNEVSAKACPCFNVQEFLAEGDPRTKPITAPAAAAGAGVAVLGAGIAAAPEWWPVAALVAVAVIAIIVIRKVRT